jgi:hypothetical protein
MLDPLLIRNILTFDGIASPTVHLTDKLVYSKMAVVAAK